MYSRNIENITKITKMQANIHFQHNIIKLNTNWTNQFLPTKSILYDK